jgi:hypothetical protein
LIDSGVIHQDVHAPEFGNRPPDGLVDGLGIGDIGDDWEGAIRSTDRSHVSRALFQPRGVEVE